MLARNRKGSSLFHNFKQTAIRGISYNQIHQSFLEVFKKYTLLDFRFSEIFHWMLPYFYNHSSFEENMFFFYFIIYFLTQSLKLSETYF